MHANFIFTHVVIFRALTNTRSRNVQECKQLSRGCIALAGVVQTAAEASKLLAVLGHQQNCKQLPRDSWILQADLSAGPLAKLQTAADPGTAGFCKRLSQLGHQQNCKQLPIERQLGFASGFLSWATSRIANSCRGTAGFCKRLSHLGHQQNCKQLQIQGQLGIASGFSAGSLVELQTAADPGTAGFCQGLSQLGLQQYCKQLGSQGAF